MGICCLVPWRVSFTSQKMWDKRLAPGSFRSSGSTPLFSAWNTEKKTWNPPRNTQLHANKNTHKPNGEPTNTALLQSRSDLMFQSQRVLNNTYFANMACNQKETTGNLEGSWGQVQIQRMIAAYAGSKWMQCRGGGTKIIQWIAHTRDNTPWLQGYEKKSYIRMQSKPLGRDVRKVE